MKLVDNASQFAPMRDALKLPFANKRELVIREIVSKFDANLSLVDTRL